MSFAASLSTLSDTNDALEAVCRAVNEQLAGATPKLAFLFVSPMHADAFETLAKSVQEAIGCEHLLGCTGESIAGGGEEIEGQAAISLWAATLPGAELESFHFTFHRTPDGLLCEGLPPLTRDEGERPNAVFILGEPFSCAIDSLLEKFETDLPGVPIFGGMASGGQAPDENRLFWNGESYTRGGVGVVLRGGPRIHSLVSQGCRPVGTHFVITRGSQNVIHELGGKPAIVRLQEVFESLNEADRDLIQRGLHVGIVMNEYQEKFERGDFLISNVLGFDQETGAIAIGNLIRTGQTVQFHVRDAETADEELVHLLAQRREAHAEFGAALLFTCNGRGTRLFSRPNHDAEAIQVLCGPLPLAGFFAQGELGPVGDKNYIHGFTASIALFEQA